MTRKKVKLAWIANDNARKASFRKRRAGLIKKVNELITLCGVEAFIIIYGPEDQEPVLTPSPEAVLHLMTRFQGIPQMDRCKKMMDQESFLKERKIKIQEQMRKQIRKNKEMEMMHFLDMIYDQGVPLIEFHPDDLANLAWFVEEKMKEIQTRLQFFERSSNPLENGAVEEENSMHNTTNDNRILTRLIHQTENWRLPPVRADHSSFIASASSSVRGDHGLFSFGNFAGGIDMNIGLPQYGSMGSFGASDIGLPHQGTIEDGSEMGLGADIGLGLNHGNFASERSEGITSQLDGYLGDGFNMSLYEGSSNGIDLFSHASGKTWPKHLSP